MAAILDVPAGAPLAPTLSRARAGDTVRLGPGTWNEALAAPAGVSVEGAGAGRTVLAAPEGEDAAVARGALSLSGLTLRAGPAHSALRVIGGEAAVRDVALQGGSCGAFVDGGSLRAEGSDLVGGLYGLLLRSGEAALAGGLLRGGTAGAAQVGGRLSLARLVVAGPSREAAVSIAGAEARLESVAIAAPGPVGLAASFGARVEARDLSVSGAAEESRGMLGDCILSLRAHIVVREAVIWRCAGAAVDVSGGTARLDGIDARGGSAGCIVLADGARAELDGDRCAGRGPSVVAASGATATARMNRWRADPAFLVECESGARIHLAEGEEVREPCRPP